MTNSQKKFVSYYLEEKDPYLAYERAYPKAASERVKRAGAKRLLKNPQVLNAIKSEPVKEVAGMEEIKEFWTKLLRDEGAKISDRLKVSELLAKAENSAAFEEAPLRVILSGEAESYAK